MHLLRFLPPSFGRRWRAAPEVGFTLFSLRPTPCPSGIPLPWEGGRWATHPASPSFLWKEVARSAGGWLRSIFAFGQPPALPREGDRRKEFSLTLEMTMRESPQSHATFGHRPYIFAAKPPPSFLISHSRKAFIHNEWAEPPHGLTLNPSPFLYAIMKKRKGAFP